jgi:hypothetical protein
LYRVVVIIVTATGAEQQSGCCQYRSVQGAALGAEEFRGHKIGFQVNKIEQGSGPICTAENNRQNKRFTEEDVGTSAMGT